MCHHSKSKIHHPTSSLFLLFPGSSHTHHAPLKQYADRANVCYLGLTPKHSGIDRHAANRHLLPMSFFVTATDTGVGKTHVTRLLLQALRRVGINAAGYKLLAERVRPYLPK